MSPILPIPLRLLPDIISNSHTLSPSFVRNTVIAMRWDGNKARHRQAATTRPIATPEAVCKVRRSKRIRPSSPFKIRSPPCFHPLVVIPLSAESAFLPTRLLAYPPSDSELPKVVATAVPLRLARALDLRSARLPSESSLRSSSSAHHPPPLRFAQFSPIQRAFPISPFSYSHTPTLHSVWVMVMVLGCGMGYGLVMVICVSSCG